jgi:hypothetical protein
MSQLDIEQFTAESTASVAAMTDEQLLARVERERNIRAYGTARGIYLKILRDELHRRGMADGALRETGVIFLDEVD